MCKCTQHQREADVSWTQRVLWLVAIWAGSVIALGVIAGAFRLMMAWAGMSTMS
ncbi:DUF2474 domain-containing protein [Pseudomonas sp. GZD-209]|uniref:DUF2474 domain-containing protein n=1 Tax=Pseudomonas sp. GZD-209 TaxID=3404807 RepID=UPI003BB72DA2